MNLKIFTSILLLSFCFTKTNAQTPETIWAGYVANPYNHPNIPNNSYAGYGTGILSLPNPSYTVYNVTSAPYNAVPNDAIDDQPAIQAAIDAAGAAGSGIVFIPAGTYYLNKSLFIKYNNVIVKGEGSTGGTATILDFRFSMYSMFKADIDASTVGRGGLWWATGLVWIGPANTFKVNGAPDMFDNAATDDYEHWRALSTLATVTAVSNPGTFSITVDNAASLSAGMKVLLRYMLPTDRSFIKEIHGHAATKTGIDNNTYVGDCSYIKATAESFYDWPAVIQSISGTTVTFDRPLRITVDPVAWPATLRSIDGIVTESGIENVQIVGHNTASMGHLVTPTSTVTSGASTLGGWNGLYINRSWNCWGKDLRFVNLEGGVLMAAAKNCSVVNTFVTSTASNRWYHHPYAFRVESSDNLIEDFTIDGPAQAYHGINAEWYASGNVYSRGLMKVGTFDTHRASPFDLIRTEITVANDAGSFPGGAAQSGPFAGKRFAHWNITEQLQSGYTYQNGTSRNGNDVYEPRQFPMGALVAITGTRDGSNGESIPPGDLGAIEATGPISNAGLINLYHAQLALRIGSTLPIKISGFTAVKMNKGNAKINWIVSEQVEGDRFVLEWGNDGLHFTDINLQTAQSVKTEYNYVHEVQDWTKQQYYRLKVIATTGAVFYSPIRKLAANLIENGSFSLRPNPTHSVVHLDMPDTKEKNAEVHLFNSEGRLVKIIAVNNRRRLTIDLKEFANGIYSMQLVGDKQVLYSKQIIKL